MARTASAVLAHEANGAEAASDPEVITVLELIIVVLVLLWLFGYFGRGRVFAMRGGRPLPTIGGYELIHVLLVIALVLLILRLLR